MTVRYFPATTRAKTWRKSAVTCGFGHFAWFVESVDAKHAELAAQGVAFPLEPKTMQNGTRIAFAADPDGYRIEFIENASPA